MQRNTRQTRTSNTSSVREKRQPAAYQTPHERSVQDAANKPEKEQIYKTICTLDVRRNRAVHNDVSIQRERAAQRNEGHSENHQGWHIALRWLHRVWSTSKDGSHGGQMCSTVNCVWETPWNHNATNVTSCCCATRWSEENLAVL